jgi:hypothetical protein
VYGLGVQCPFELPELDSPTSLDSQAWRIEACSGPAPDAALKPTGIDTVYGSVRVRSSISDDFARLTFDDTGTFDLHLSARLIRWYRGPDSNTAAVRADLLGRVLAMAAHGDGAFVLHASAVTIDGGVIAFLGPKQAGKSTLAMALLRRGARLVTDDTLAVRFAPDGPVAAPGVQRVRLWPDSVRAIGATAAFAVGAKPTIDGLGADSLENAVRPLVACYVLRPVPDDVPFARHRLSDVYGAVAGVSFSKLGGLAGGRLAVEVLERSTHLAQLLSMYAVDVPRDLDRLDGVARDFMAWHRALEPNVASLR